MQMRDPNTLPAGLEHMRRQAVDLSAVAQRVAAVERLVVPSPFGADGTVLTSTGAGTQPAWEALPSAIACGRAYPSSAKNHSTSGVWEKVPLDLADTPLSGLTFDDANDQLVVVTAGVYGIQTNVGFTTTAANQIIQCRPYINGSPSVLGTISPNNVNSFVCSSPLLVYPLGVGGTIQMWAWQNIATPRAYIIDASYTFMSVFRIGPS